MFDPVLVCPKADVYQKYFYRLLDPNRQQLAKQNYSFFAKIIFQELNADFGENASFDVVDQQTIFAGKYYFGIKALEDFSVKINDSRIIGFKTLNIIIKDVMKAWNRAVCYNRLKPLEAKLKSDSKFEIYLNNNFDLVVLDRGERVATISYLISEEPNPSIKVVTSDSDIVVDLQDFDLSNHLA